jgi:hypothetical protein
MVARKSGSLSKPKPAKAKTVKAAPKKNAATTAKQESLVPPAAKDHSAAMAAPVKKKEKVKQKVKLIRDSFGMPKNEYLALSDLKLRSARLGMPAKKSEILRAGVAVLSKMSDTLFSTALDAIPSLKTVLPKPKKSKKVDTKKPEKKA